MCKEKVTRDEEVKGLRGQRVGWSSMWTLKSHDSEAKSSVNEDGRKMSALGRGRRQESQ